MNQPTESAALIEGDTLTLVSGGREERIDLAQNATVRGFVESFRYVLAGDREALEEIYDVDFEARADEGPRAWKLTLRPKTQALRRFLREMVLEGDGPTIETMRMTEVSGDVTRSEFFEVNARRRWSSRELRDTFEL
ncbi:MAG: LolA-related protein [Myxococcota bacterium]